MSYWKLNQLLDGGLSGCLAGWLVQNIRGLEQRTTAELAADERDHSLLQLENLCFIPSMKF